MFRNFLESIFTLDVRFRFLYILFLRLYSYILSYHVENSCFDMFGLS